MGKYDLKTNLNNLHAQVQAGMWPNDDQLKSAVMNLWKGRDYDPPESRSMSVTTNAPGGVHTFEMSPNPPDTTQAANIRISTTVGHTGTAPLALGTPVAMAMPTVPLAGGEPIHIATQAFDEEGNTAPSDTRVPAAPEACSMRKRHGPLKAKGRACDECGYNQQEG